MEAGEGRTRKRTAKQIKIRKIRHGNIKKASINKNCPKFILGHCWLNFKDHITRYCAPAAKPHVEESYRIIEQWISGSDRDKLTLNNLR